MLRFLTLISNQMVRKYVEDVKDKLCKIPMDVFLAHTATQMDRQYALGLFHNLYYYKKNDLVVVTMSLNLYSLELVRYFVDKDI